MSDVEKVLENWSKRQVETAKEMGRERARARLDAVGLIKRVERIVERLETTRETISREALVADKVQLDAIFRMMNKVLPDLKAIEHSGQIDRRTPHELSDAELAAIATGRSHLADGETEGTGAVVSVQ